MGINYLAVLVCGVLSMAIGAIWYGPLFGKKWMEIVGVTPEDMAKRKEMQKAAGPLYLVQFILTLFQAFVVAYGISVWDKVSRLPGSFYINGLGIFFGLTISMIVWAAFIMPTIAGSSMWNNDSSKVKRARFLIQSGYQLVNFVVFGLVLGVWR